MSGVLPAPTPEMVAFIEKHGKLDPAFKKQWLAALRSGNYKQGIGELQTKTGEFCCLGVACDITGPRTTRFWAPNGHRKATIPLQTRDIPRVLKGTDNHWSPTKNPVVKFLAKHNDDGVSFKRIATWVEKYL